MERLPHHERLDDAPAHELALERRAPKADRPRPDPDVRRRGPLRLHPDQALDHRLRREALPFEQKLARERGAVELAQREDALRHTAHASSHKGTAVTTRRRPRSRRTPPRRRIHAT
jgi:hypothetical protein